MRSLLIIAVVCAAARADTTAGDALFAARRYREAAAAYRTAAGADPDDVEARYRLGVALAAGGELIDAAEAWESVLALAPGHARARRNLELARLRTEPREDPVLVVPYLRALVAQGRAASALVGLDRLLTEPEHVRDTELLALRGDIHLALGDPAAAIDDFARLLLVTPRAARPYRGLAAAWRAAGAADRAAYFERLAAARGR